MTARHWRRKPPKIGEVVRAQLGYGRDTTFALIRIVGVRQWNGTEGEVRNFMAIREGYPTPKAFYKAYHGFNAKNWWDDKRTHYFIEFLVEKEVR